MTPDDVTPPPLTPEQHILSRAVHRSQDDDDSEWWQVSYTIATFQRKNPRHCFSIGTLYQMSYELGRWRNDPDSGVTLTHDEYAKLRVLLLAEASGAAPPETDGTAQAPQVATRTVRLP